MKKLLIVLVLVAGLAVVAIVASSFFLGSIVTAGVNTVGPRLTGTKVTLDGATISPLSGSGTLSGFFVGNPEGWQSDRAFYLGKVHLDVAPRSLLGDTIVIEEVLIDDPQFVYETKIVSSNIKELLNHIEKVTGGGAAAETSGEAPPKKIILKKFVLQNGEVTLGAGAAAVTVPMPALTLTDLGVAEGGLTPAQLSVAIMRQVLGNVVSAAASAAGQIGSSAGGLTKDALGEAAKKAGEGIKNLFSNEKK